ncbi:serine carboxypeptidase-like 51 isoform X2 [Zea mays]|uniref:serine carboxypeptidase-like 51 isoform X2 n=1 Tax=Zea mays TaxID=4577 RepID=UPI0004DE9B95|nr:serine carboxypeptidase-like 51 isoform X2 [Zea mays]|eukprot:XP_008660021.1 serine carboxypeptidase-like 51 isoform X2 [Zea mays]
MVFGISYHGDILYTPTKQCFLSRRRGRGRRWDWETLKPHPGYIPGNAHLPQATHLGDGQVRARAPLPLPRRAPCRFRRAYHHRDPRRLGAVGVRRSPAKGSPVLVVLQEPAPDVDAQQAMADHPLAAGRPGRVRRRARQLPGGGAAGRGPEAAELDVAAEGRPHLRGQPGGRRVQLRGGRQPAGDDRLGAGGGRHRAAQGAGQGGADAAGQPAVPGRRVLRRQVRRHAGRVRRQGRPRGRAQGHAGSLCCRLFRARAHKGVALGDSFVSPVDFTVSYVPLLLSVSRLDDNAAGEANKRTQTVKDQIAAGQFAASQGSWNDLLAFIDTKSGSVQDVYNFLLDSGMDPVSTDSSPSSSSPSSVLQALRYSTYLGSQLGDSSAGSSNTIDGIMNGVIKEKLKIIPKDVRWVEVSNAVYYALVNDFMKPRIDEIDELLSYGVNVTVYNGQLDVICSTDGAEAWVQKLKWDGLKTFLSLPRQPLYCGPGKGTKAFVRSYKNLHFYWILGAGHFVPADQPCIALSMIGSITQSPAS